MTIYASAPEAAEILGIHVNTVYAKCEDGTIKHTKFGHRIAIDQDDLHNIEVLQLGGKKVIQRKEDK